MVLRTVGDILRSNVRGADTVARYGGEEFVILLPETELHGCSMVGENLRARIERHRFEGEDRQPGGALTRVHDSNCRPRPGIRRSCPSRRPRPTRPPAPGRGRAPGTPVAGPRKLRGLSPQPHHAAFADAPGAGRPERLIERGAAPLKERRGVGPMRGVAAYTAPDSAGLSAGFPHGAHGGPHGASRIARQPGEPYRSPAKALSAADRMRSAVTVVHPMLLMLLVPSFRAGETADEALEGPLLAVVVELYPHR